MVLQENIIKLKDLLIKTKQTDENLEFFVNSYLALLYVQLEEYIKTNDNINFVKDIITELEKYNIDINVLSTLIK
jgi:hypothetical protein